MFDKASGIGLMPGESIDYGDDDYEAEEQLAYEATCRGFADGWAEDDRHVLPDDLESIPNGIYLTAIITSVDRSKLNGHDAVRLMQAEARLSSHHEAGKLASMAEVAFSPPGNADSAVERSCEEVEYVAAEIAAALTLTRRASETELSRAVSLTDRLRRVWSAFSKGLVDLAKVKVFDSHLGHLPEDTVNTVLDHILDEASELTTGQLRARVSRHLMEADPDGAASSFQEGLDDRKVTANANPDLTGSLHILSGHPLAVAAARVYIEKHARRLKTKDETRTLDQLRNDVALDLLRGRRLGTESGGGRVNVTISAETLLELSDTPGELEGYGPVIAEISRKAVRENIDGAWVFTVTDNGLPVATGTLTRRPTAGQQRQIQAHYPTCVWPGCRQPGVESDIDHRHPWADGGATDTHNLAPLSRHHHIIRHNTKWKVERLTNGDHKWTSPLGHVYIRKRDPPD